MADDKPKRPRTREINLLRVFDGLNTKQFGGKLCAGITWKNIRIGEGHATLALACKEDRIIEVNTMLRDVRFPLWYVRYVVYHEMCHLVHGHRHDETFHALERQYPDFEKAQAFEDKKLDAIEDDWRAYRKSRLRGGGSAS